jgi:hypothetical protein
MAKEETSEPSETGAHGFAPITGTATPAPIGLPSENIAYAAVLENELHNRMHTINAALAALEAERDGAEAKHLEQLADLNEAHVRKITGLNRQIEDWLKAQRIASAGLDEAQRAPQRESDDEGNSE